MSTLSTLLFFVPRHPQVSLVYALYILQLVHYCNWLAFFFFLFYFFFFFRYGNRDGPLNPESPTLSGDSSSNLVMFAF